MLPKHLDHASRPCCLPSQNWHDTSAFLEYPKCSEIHFELQLTRDLSDSLLGL